MIKRSTGKDGVKLTFALSLQDTPQPVSVCGDFNDWDPLAHPLKKRANGTRSASVVVAPGRTYAFKYLSEGGNWFNDLDADSHTTNEYGEVNSVLTT
jgi:1,4-alpha-glucan branching enzyme